MRVLGYNKLKNNKVYVNGQVFDSKLEYSRWLELKLLEKAGKIEKLERQVPFVLIPAQYTEVKIDGKVKKKCIERACNYIADFVYIENGKMIVEDTKGYTQGIAYELYVIKRKLMLEKLKIKIKEIKK